MIWKHLPLVIVMVSLLSVPLIASAAGHVGKHEIRSIRGFGILMSEGNKTRVLASLTANITRDEGYAYAEGIFSVNNASYKLSGYLIRVKRVLLMDMKSSDGSVHLSLHSLRVIERGGHKFLLMVGSADTPQGTCFLVLAFKVPDHLIKRTPGP